MLKRVRERELGIGRAEFRRRNARARFSSYRLEQQHDTHDPDAANLKLSFLRRRSKIVEIVAAGDVVFALTLSGVCAAFCGSRRIAFLNTMPDEVIRSLFYNKANRSLITVSVYRDDNFSSLKCRTTPIEYIRRGQPDAGFALFESECLKWPGFVEFDDVNGKVLTYSVLDKAYRVWDMTNYEELYVMREPEIAEIKISPGIMLVIYNRVADHVPLKVVNIEDGATLRQFNHPLHRTRKIDFIEQFNEKLLVKQEGEPLQIIDVHTHSLVSVATTDFLTPAAFIFEIASARCRLHDVYLLPTAADARRRDAAVTRRSGAAHSAPTPPDAHADAYSVARGEPPGDVVLRRDQACAGGPRPQRVAVPPPQPKSALRHAARGPV